MISVKLFKYGLILVGLLSASSAMAEATETLIQTLTTNWKTKLLNARYLEKNPVSITWPGYEGYPTVKCTYTTKDTAGTYAGQTKTADVILLNPPPELVSRWVVNGLIDVTGSADITRANKIMQSILSASGSQYPVAGMVYEDMEGDGTQNLYCFRDGLTVYVSGISSGRTSPLSEAERQITMTGTLTGTGSYARIISTTREMYTANGGSRDVGTASNKKLEYLNAIREDYKKGFDTGHNPLIEAWIRAQSAYKPNQSPPVGSFPYYDNFTATGKGSTSWLDKNNYHHVRQFTPIAPGGDGYILNVLNPAGGSDTASLGKATDTNYVVSADIYCDYRPSLASDGYERVGIFARDIGGNFENSVTGALGNNYFMSWDSDDGHFRCAKTNNGVITNFFTTKRYLPTTAWRRMSIEVVNSTITYKLDGITQITVTDTDFPTGKFGIGYRENFKTNSNQRGARADNFSARLPYNSNVNDWQLMN